MSGIWIAAAWRHFLASAGALIIAGIIDICSGDAADTCLRRVHADSMHAGAK